MKKIKARNDNKDSWSTEDTAVVATVTLILILGGISRKLTNRYTYQ